MDNFKKILGMDLFNLFTNPMWLAYAIVFPLVLVLVMGFLTSASYGSTVTSYDYYGIAMMIYIIFNAATFSANGFMEERVKNPNMRLVYSPVKPFFIHFSKVLATFVFCSVTFTLVGAVLYLVVGVNYGGGYFGLIYLLMLLAIFFFSALGVMVCCVLRSENSTNQLLSIILTLFGVLGGLFFPLDGFGKAISAISWMSPAKWIFSACMQIIYNRDISMYLPACGVMVMLSAAAVGISAKLFKGEDYI